MKRILNIHGLTLLEVMVSMIILTVGILGLAPLIALTVDSNTISRDVMEASNLAKEKIEEFENQDTLPTLPYIEKESNLVDGYYRLTKITENTTDTTLPAGMCEMSVTISWTDKTGQSRTTAYSTILQKE